MEYNCPNCNQAISGNFCSNCGQKKYKRIDKKYLWDEVQYTVLHTNKGFLYSVKKIIRNPGRTAREFIDGNRVNHYKPILLAFVLSGISAFVSYKIVGMSHIMQAYLTEFYAQRKLPTTFISDWMSFVSSYNSVIMLLAIPIVSVFTRFVFRKWGQNYYEHVIMNAYIQCCFTIANILVVYPILFLLRDDTSNFMFVSSFSMVIIPFIMVWFYHGFYPDKKMEAIIGKMLLFLLFGLLAYVVFIVVFAVCLVISHPEMFKGVGRGK